MGFDILGSRGDVQPYTTLGNGLKPTGHQVRFIHEKFANAGQE